MFTGECNLKGYHSLEFRTRNNTTNTRGGVGTCMYIKNTLSYKVRNDLSIFISNVLESIFCEIQLCNKSIIVGTIYRPNTPPKADLDIFTHTIHELQQQLNDDNKETYIMGDMNIDLLQYENYQKTNEYLDNIFSLGYIPLISKPTRITPHSATFIDHIYTNKNRLQHHPVF